MHQTFYIDIDEEITSIIERLRKSAAREVVIVVPKRALLIQSIINLKLLKKEADELSKEIIIVTQDKLGRLLVEKTGIAVEQKLNDVPGEEMLMAEQAGMASLKDDREEYNLETKNKLKSRLETIGSPGFFDSESASQVKEKEVNFEIKKEEEIGAEKLINRELVTGIEDSLKNQKHGADKKETERTLAMDMVRSIDIKQKGADFSETRSGVGRSKTIKKVQGEEKLFKQEQLDNKELQNEDKPNLPGQQLGSRFFSEKKASREKEDNSAYANVSLSQKSRRFFTIFGFVAAAVILLAAGYLFLPKATVTIFVKTKLKSLDAEVKADAGASSIDFGKKTIPAKAISLSDEITKNFDSTGTKGASNHKARGTVTIYNEYSSANQPLVATTRFLSESGKLFRLANGVIVPGVTKIGAEEKPGAIEAEVVADEAGEEFNIEPSKFTIPGFQGSGNEKYSKIYGKSFKAMSGGANGTETARSITEADISSAKEKTLSELTVAVKQKIKEQAGQGFIVPDDGFNIANPVYKISSAAGEIADNFSVTVKISAGAIGFKEDDIREVLKNILADSSGADSKIISDSINFELGKTDADFANSALTIRLHAAGKIMSNLDLESIKKEILGKNEQDLEAYLKSYSDIERVEVAYRPTFISGRIPSYGNQVEMKLDNN